MGNYFKSGVNANENDLKDKLANINIQKDDDSNFN